MSFYLQVLEPDWIQHFVLRPLNLFPVKCGIKFFYCQIYKCKLWILAQQFVGFAWKKKKFYTVSSICHLHKSGLFRFKLNGHLFVLGLLHIYLAISSSVPQCTDVHFTNSCLNTDFPYLLSKTATFFFKQNCVPGRLLIRHHFTVTPVKINALGASLNGINSNWVGE